MRKRIDGGRLYDTTTSSFFEASLLLDDRTGRVVALGDTSLEADEIITLTGEAIFPGYIDMHVHLRDPGFTHKETLATGLQAAAAGGFTQVACMPNTNPPTDTPDVVDDIVSRGRDVKKAEVHPIACITVSQSGLVLTDFERLQAAGAVGLSDDGKGVQNGSLMMDAMRKAAALNLPVIIHSEDETLSGSGVIHPDAASRLHVLGIPVEAEAAMIARDVLLAERTGAHLHVCHVSTEPSVAIIRWAKARGIRVTAEVTPHHLLLDESLIQRDDATYKVNPPLQSRRDQLACLEGFLDGTLDIIATDHAPHTAEEKAKGMSGAPFGMVGLEIAFPLLYTYLVLPGIVPLGRLIEAMTSKPAQLFGLAGGVIRPGAVADLVIVDLTDERVIDAAKFYSKGQNTPFHGWHAVGFPTRTMLRGNDIFHAGEERWS